MQMNGEDPIKKEMPKGGEREITLEKLAGGGSRVQRRGCKGGEGSAGEVSSPTERGSARLCLW